MKLTVISIIIAITLFLNACALRTDEAIDTPSHLGVYWHEGFSLPSLLKIPRKAESQEDIHAMRFESWYGEFDVVNSNNDVISISSCDEYFSKLNDDWSTVSPPDYGYLMVLVRMCRAADLIAQAQPPEHSTLVYPLIGENLPQQLPHEVAFVLAEPSYIKELRQNPEVQTMADVFSIYEDNDVVLTSPGPNQFRFDFEGAVQQISLVGRGDFTGDGLEDILLWSQYNVKGGSYWATQLFLLSPDDSGERFNFVREL